ncbi:DUF447 domain-containing protein [Tuwongella immobilis]|uniref:DUF447 family protein n=1 Tax=Tuwongella immobilis TaxID=692036 RepID=A0A6C2YNX3_9BACT|nr:DUF447 domain-containing protein [Tuwongella immobilis]VIP03136.1 protein containing duf447 : Conserved protein OS=Gemmata sp. Wa1-1 PE=4 SV=1: DUF447 [Tuwongella immobilis]VTS03496.1 protein containing duf447 : Conserved protein OS=Gemmata sp. Wa1-1 PE=4 SV=1: DUF447 [Tuwongella immobilis]
MILEGLLCTRTAGGQPHLAPMGPAIDLESGSLTFKPFQSSTSYANLVRDRVGVFHVTDDVLLLAQAAIGKVPLLPANRPARQVPGFVLREACRVMEFEVVSIDDRQDRAIVQTRTVHSESLRDFFGFNRAKHLVLEAAILATRFHLLNLSEVAQEFRRMAVIVNKTGGPQELAAMEFLQMELEDRMSIQPTDQLPPLSAKERS